MSPRPDRFLAFAEKAAATTGRQKRNSFLPQAASSRCAPTIPTRRAERRFQSLLRRRARSQREKQVPIVLGDQTKVNRSKLGCPGAHLATGFGSPDHYVGVSPAF